MIWKLIVGHCVDSVKDRLAIAIKDDRCPLVLVVIYCHDLQGHILMHTSCSCLTRKNLVTV